MVKIVQVDMNGILELIINELWLIDFSLQAI